MGGGGGWWWVVVVVGQPITDPLSQGLVLTLRSLLALSLTKLFSCKHKSSIPFNARNGIGFPPPSNSPWTQLTNTDIGGDAADVEVSHLLVLNDLLERGLAHLGVVKEGGVGVHLGVDPLVDDPGLGMNLEVRM